MEGGGPLLVECVGCTTTPETGSDVDLGVLDDRDRFIGANMVSNSHSSSGLGNLLTHCVQTGRTSSHYVYISRIKAIPAINTNLNLPRFAYFAT
jgi:hypothetical protein